MADHPIGMSRRACHPATVTNPPIVPGRPDEPSPQQWPAQPPPVQYVPAPQSDVVGRSVVGTITVVVTLVLIFCILPMFLCVGCGTIGQIMNNR